jgi:hypothetical protein
MCGGEEEVAAMGGGDDGGGGDVVELAATRADVGRTSRHDASELKALWRWRGWRYELELGVGGWV